jgi:hypothetical protein
VCAESSCQCYPGHLGPRRAWPCPAQEPWLWLHQNDDIYQRGLKDVGKEKPWDRKERRASGQQSGRERELKKGAHTGHRHVLGGCGVKPKRSVASRLGNTGGMTNGGRSVKWSGFQRGSDVNDVGRCRSTGLASETDRVTLWVIAHFFTAITGANSTPHSSSLLSQTMPYPRLLHNASGASSLMPHSAPTGRRLLVDDRRRQIVAPRAETGAYRRPWLVNPSPEGPAVTGSRLNRRRPEPRGITDLSGKQSRSRPKSFDEEVKKQAKLTIL